MSSHGERRRRPWRATHLRGFSRQIALIAALILFGLSARLLIAPYTGHGYDINVHKVWLFKLLDNGLFFYASSEGMGLFGESWGHDPNFCELPPIFPSTLFIMGKAYTFVQRGLDDFYLLVMFMKIPQIVAEISIAVLVYYIVRKETNLRLGALAALLFLVNPFTFFLTAVWGAPESLVAVFVLASLYATYRSRPFLAAFLLGASLMVKPYAIVFLIPIILFSYRDLKFPRTLLLPLITAFSAAIIASPWLVAQGLVFIDAMWSGAVHNLGIRMLEGTIWSFPSFWLLVRSICDISGFPYAVVAPVELYVYLFLTLVLCLMVIRSGSNLDKRNLWFMANLFLFSFMMFLPSAHEKWVYSCFPLLPIAAFLGRKQRTISLLAYFGLTLTLFGAIYGNGQYFFVSTDLLPMPRNFVYGGVFAEFWYYALWSVAGAIASLFSSALSVVFPTAIFFILFARSLIQQAQPEPDAPSKKPSENTLKKETVADPLQIRLDSFRTPPPRKSQPSPSVNSAEPIEDETIEVIDAFQSHFKNVKETSLKLDEARRMLKSGEVGEDMCRLIVDELGEQLSTTAEEMYKLRESLELARARAKLERAKEETELKWVLTPERQDTLRRDAYLRRKLYAPLHRWQEVTSKIDTALASLTIEEEASIIQQCLSLMREKPDPHTLADENERRKRLCQQRLDAVSDKWASIRRDKIEQIFNIEQNASQITQEMREVETRFAVGELNQDVFEYRIGALRGALKRFEKEILDTQNCLDEMDKKIFRCSELLKEIP